MKRLLRIFLTLTLIIIFPLNCFAGLSITIMSSAQ